MDTSHTSEMIQAPTPGKLINFESSTDYPRWMELERRQGNEFRTTKPASDSKLVTELGEDRILLIADALNAKPTDTFISIARQDILDFVEEVPLPRDRELPEIGLLIEDEYKHWLESFQPELEQTVKQTDLSIGSGNPIAELQEVMRRIGQSAQILSPAMEYTDAQLLRFMFYTYFRDPLRITEDSIEGSLMSVGLALTAIDKRFRQHEPLSYDQLHDIVISPEFNKVLRGLAFTKNSVYRNSPGNGMSFSDLRARVSKLENLDLDGKHLVSLDNENHPYISKESRNALIFLLKQFNATSNKENEAVKVASRKIGLVKRVGSAATYSIRIPTGDAELVASKSSGCPVIHRKMEITLLTDEQLAQLEQDGIGVVEVDEEGKRTFSKTWDSIDATCQLVGEAINILAA